MSQRPVTLHITWTANDQYGVCEGELGSVNETVSPEYVYVDLIYDADFPLESYIEISCGSFHQRNPVSGSGRHCLSVKIPCSELLVIGKIEFKAPVTFQVERAVLRTDFYDFLRLRSQFQDDAQVMSNEQEALLLGRLLDLVVCFFIEWQCDYACPYCWQEVHSSHFRGQVDNRRGPRDWAAALNRVRPKEIHISGGEPALYEHLPELLSLIDPEIELGIHTNFGPAFNLEDWSERVAPDRLRLISLSYHPTEVEASRFFPKLESFLEMGAKNLGVQMVLHPANFSQTREVLDRCRALRIPANFVPYVPADARAAGRTEELLAEMRQWIQLAKALWLELGATVFDSIDYDMEQYWELPNAAAANQSEASSGRSCIGQRKSWGRLPLFCNAGSRTFVVDPEGYAYVCLSALVRAKIFDPCSLPHYAPIGNILDEDFRLLERPLICWESFRCSGDQFQHLSPAWTLLSDTLGPLPLPE
jgi:MoaA/NifB/PqqE/SkfB family radical SAM enzyme